MAGGKAVSPLRSAVALQIFVVRARSCRIVVWIARSDAKRTNPGIRLVKPPGTGSLTEMRITRTALIGAVVIVAMAALTGWWVSEQTEPAWQGRSLTEWLEAYDSHNWFEPGDNLYSPLSDEEIEQAFGEMRSAALPVLLRWVSASPSRLKPRLNRQLSQQSWVRFRFEERNYRILAVTGIMAYGEEAQPLLPELLKRSHHPDADTRLAAYAAAFFTRPDKADFLPLATRALQEANPSIGQMAAHWLRERFPEETQAILGHCQ